MTKYKYLFSLNALIYLSLPIFALFPEMTSYIFRVAPFEGSRLDNFQNLMFAVTPIGNFPFTANGKALALGEDEGFIKTIFDKNTGELLGAHLVGAEVTELISTYIVGKGLETTPDEFLSNIFPHPTMSEMLYESVLSSESKAIHY